LQIKIIRNKHEYEINHLTTTLKLLGNTTKSRPRRKKRKKKMGLGEKGRVKRRGGNRNRKESEGTLALKI